MIHLLRSARPVGRFAFAGAANPALLALVVVTGVLGLAVFAALLLLRPAGDTPPVDRGAALRSLLVVPFASKDPSLTELAPRFGEALGQSLAKQMPHVRVVVGKADSARLQLDGEMRDHGADVEVALWVRDRRDARQLADERAHFPRAKLDSAEAVEVVASRARRAVTAAMFRLAAEE